MTSSKSNLQSHLERVFDFKFNSFEDVEGFFEHAPDVESLALSVKDKDRFIFDIEASPLPLDQIELILNDFEEKLTVSPHAVPHKMRLLKSFLGRFMQANNTLAHCDLFGGVPIIDAPTSWQYFLWKLEYSASQLIEEAKDTIVSHVLHEELGDIPCFSNVPVQGIIELRKGGKLRELREVFRKGIVEISSVDGDAVEDVAKKVSKNLRDALQEYEAQIQEIPKDILSISGQSVVTAGSVGLCIAAASTGSIPLGIIAALIGAAGVPSAKDIIKKGREIYQNRRRLKSNPVGIFWKI